MRISGQSNMNFLKTQMRWKPFLLCHLVAFLLLGSWLFAPTRAFWNLLDLRTFSYLNEALQTKPLTQIFWALTNVKSADAFGALFMAIFFLLYAFDAKNEERRLRVAQFLYLCLWGEIGILLSKEVLEVCMQKISFIRESPTLTFHNAVKLSQAIPWLKVKDVAKSCFPSDHAIILFQWFAFVLFFCPWRYRIAAFFWIAFFTMPRLIAGAHWLSDTLVGSISYVAILMAWATCTPLYGYLMNFFIQLTNKFHKEAKTAYEHTSAI